METTQDQEQLPSLEEQNPELPGRLWPTEPEELPTKLVATPVFESQEPPLTANDEAKVHETHDVLIRAKDAELGKEYADWAGHCVYIVTRKDPAREYVFVTGLHRLGLDYHEHEMVDMVPLSDNPELVADVKRDHAYYKAKEAGQAVGSKAPSKSAKARANPEGESTPKRATRGDVDPRTGYAQGTDSHIFGTIILDTGTKIADKAACIEKIYEVLRERGKPRGYAGAWYNQLRKQHPEIYVGKED